MRNSEFIIVTVRETKEIHGARVKKRNEQEGNHLDKWVDATAQIKFWCCTTPPPQSKFVVVSAATV